MTRQPLVLHGGLFAGVAVGAAVLAALWPASGAVRSVALAGVGACVVTGVFALLMKRRAGSLNGALLAVVVVFGIRALVVTAGAALAAKRGGGAMPFVWGFFGTYFPMQWVEVSYLLSAAKQAKSQEVERR